MFEKVENCPSCGHPKFDNHLICTDHTVSGESFALVKCAKCELIFTNPRPSTDQLPSYYKSEDYISHTNQANNLVNRIYKLVRSITLKQKLQLISRKNTDRRLLDFGCGTGHFINYCEKKGWKVTGVEPDSKAHTIADEQTSGTIYSSIDNVKDTYNVITAWHVLEHVPDLSQTLKKLTRLLDEKGLLFIALPNCESHDAKHYKENWAGYDVPRHLYHFTQQSFNELIKKHKLRLLETHPMIFDAYYVSLLSEKYITGSNQFFKAFKLGRNSNKLAKSDSNYSSLIYVLSK